MQPSQLWTRWLFKKAETSIFIAKRRLYDSGYKQLPLACLTRGRMETGRYVPALFWYSQSRSANNQMSGANTTLLTWLGLIVKHFLR